MENKDNTVDKALTDEVSPQPDPDQKVEPKGNEQDSTELTPEDLPKETSKFDITKNVKEMREALKKKNDAFKKQQSELETVKAELAEFKKTAAQPSSTDEVATLKAELKAMQSSFQEMQVDSLLDREIRSIVAKLPATSDAHISAFIEKNPDFMEHPQGLAQAFVFENFQKLSATTVAKPAKVALGASPKTVPQVQPTPEITEETRKQWAQEIKKSHQYVRSVDTSILAPFTKPSK